MTALGGRDVAAAAQAAGFVGDEIRRAQVIAYAATRWEDHYQSEVPGVPALTQWGLFATNPNYYDPANPRALFDPITSAKDAYRYWQAAGGTWDWHPVVRVADGALVRGAWHTIEQGRLWGSKASDHTTHLVALGHPGGPLPSRLPDGTYIGGIARG